MGKYDPKFIAVAKKMCSSGATDVDLAEAFEVSRKSIQVWRVRHKDFGAACEVGVEAANRNVRRALYHKAVGYDYTLMKSIKLKDSGGDERVEMVEEEFHVPPDTVAIKFWLVNKDRDEDGTYVWREKLAVGGDPDGAPIDTKLTVEFV